MTVLVTGADGFVGRALSGSLRAGGTAVSAAARKKAGVQAAGTVNMPDLSSSADWLPLLKDIDVVVHTAARVHVMQESSSDPLAEFRAVNRDGTLALARQAAAAGVRRFVFVSSVKVNGEATAPDRPFTAGMAAPVDPYGISKHEAEIELNALALSTGMQVTIVRPPLVYGPGVRGNFLTMMKWLKRGVPLPLGGLHNRRSLVALPNLVDFLALCTIHESAGNQTFLISDGEDLSTTELLKRLAAAMDVKAHLLPLPSGLIELAGACLGRRDLVQRICGSLQVDASPARQILGWSPVTTIDAALRMTAGAFLGTNGHAKTQF